MFFHIFAIYSSFFAFLPMLHSNVKGAILAMRRLTCLVALPKLMKRLADFVD